MKDRITQFLKIEGISPAEFADKIGVQRSSVSHVLNGRNYPSASFIQKMLTTYTTLNSRWLMLGEGSVFDAHALSNKEPSLFREPTEPEKAKVPLEDTTTGTRLHKEISNQPPDNFTDKPSSASELKQPAELNFLTEIHDLNSYINDNKDVDRIVFFFKDKTFTVYTPSK